MTALTEGVIGAAIEVHQNLGPGYLESVYEEAMAIELDCRKIAFQRQYAFTKQYKGHEIGTGRLDFLVDEVLVVELKAVDRLLPIHQAQVISYLKATSKPLGLLLNFNVTVMKAGIRRVVLSQ